MDKEIKSAEFCLADSEIGNTGNLLQIQNFKFKIPDYIRTLTPDEKTRIDTNNFIQNQVNKAVSSDRLQLFTIDLINGYFLKQSRFYENIGLDNYRNIELDTISQLTQQFSTFVNIR